MQDPFGIYIHWPFCVSKCPYCDFNSHVEKEKIDSTLWLKAYVNELERIHQIIPNRVISSIFFGGGTPSLMAPSLISALLEKIYILWPSVDNVEITLEANPGTVDQKSFKDFRGVGINRLSMGIQSLKNDSLSFLGRIHTSDQAITAIELASSIFPRLSLDFIYALPNQTLKEWAAELEKIISFKTKHLSLYQLTIEKGTDFKRQYNEGVFQLPQDDLSCDLYKLTQSCLKEAGFVAYEVSNFAYLGEESRHNMLYWQGDEFIGIGPGAHGRYRNASGQVVATQQHKAPEKWLKASLTGNGDIESDVLNFNDYIEELILMGLRLKNGIHKANFLRKTNKNLDHCLDQKGLNLMISEGYLINDKDRLKTSDEGVLLLNSILQKIIV
jgi:oxygen-independent coproporphyrinogen-3 oxidase